MFRDRVDAGRQLAIEVRRLELRDPVVLALPRGGVPVGAEVAAALAAPLDVFVARKVGAPQNPEYGIGAVAEGGAAVANAEARAVLPLPAATWDELVARSRAELDRRVARYRGGRGLPPLEGHDVVLVDDGLATGVTAEAALHALRERRVRQLVLAVPAGARETVARLASLADRVVCVTQPEPFHAVGQCYQRFEQTTDEEVLDLLERAATARQEPPTPS